MAQYVDIYITDVSGDSRALDLLGIQKGSPRMARMPRSQSAEIGGMVDCNLKISWGDGEESSARISGKIWAIRPDGDKRAEAAALAEEAGE